MLIKVPQGQDIEHAGEGTLKEILVAEDKALLKQFIAARVGDERVDFHTWLSADAEEFVNGVQRLKGTAKGKDAHLWGVLGTAGERGRQWRRGWGW